MSSSPDHPLKRVSNRILEEWAMMIADEVEGEECPFDSSDALYMGWIDVHGPITGALSVVAQKPFMQTLATNLLGSDEEETPSEEECFDALREMTNVLAGNFFIEAYGENVVFDLINPSVSEVPASELERIAGRRVKYYFLGDDQPVVITFSVRE